MKIIGIRLFLIIPFLFVFTGCITTIQNVQYTKGTEAKEAGQYDKAFKLFLPLAENDTYQGNSSAKYIIAEFFEKGQGVQRNMATALDWYKRAAASSDEIWANYARYHLGWLYSRSKHIPKNTTESYKWYNAVTGNDQGKALALQGSAYAYAEEKKYGKAIDVREAAIKIYDRLGKKEEIPQLRFFIAANFQDQGSYEEALRNYHEASELYKSIGKLPDAGRVLGIAAILISSKGKYKDALNLYNESLRLTKNSSDKSDYISALTGIAGVYFTIGEFDTAYKYEEEALKVSRKYQSLEDIANIYHSLGVTLSEWGQYQKALKTYRDGLEEINRAQVNSNFPLEHEFNKTLFHSGIGQLFLVLKKPDEAKPHIDKIVQISNRLIKNGDSITLINSTFGMYGDYYLLKEDFDLAEEWYSKALSHLGSNSETNEPLNLIGIAGINQSLGSLNVFRGNYEAAIKHFKIAININRNSQRPQRLVHNLNNLAYTYGKLKKLKKATKYYEASLRLAEKLRTTASGTARATYLAKSLSTYQNLSVLYLLDKNPVKSLEITEHARARLLSEMILKTKGPVKSFKIEKFYEYTRRDEAALIFSNVEWNISTVTLLRSEGLSYRQILTKNKLGPVYAKFKNEIEDAYKNLPGFEVDEEQLIETAADRRVKRKLIRKLVNYYRYLISNPQVEVNASIVKDPRGLVVSKKSNQKLARNNLRNVRLNQIGKALYKLLIKPIEEKLVGKRRLIIVPDGVLGFLPFETLIDENGQYLIEKFDITYSPSLTVRQLISERSYSRDRQPMIAFGGAIYDGQGYNSDIIKDKIELAAFSRGLLNSLSRGIPLGDKYSRLGVSKWSNLPGTVQEVRDIAKILSGTKLYTGKEVNEGAVKMLSEQGELSKYRVLHFATHGITLPQIPELSALVLSQNSGDNSREDGYLNLSEISKLKLKADYVVLSACQTGLGKLFRGEGVYGLTQAFIVAGANAVLVSLWSVADKSTATFMREFYKTAKERGLLFYKALTETKRKFIVGKFGEKWRDPFFWAPFVQYGDS